jgi:drug/metabolite transporter (DMT)-like permease
MTAAAAVAFSGKAIIVKLAYRHGVDAITLLALRMLFAAPMFLVLAWWATRAHRATALARRDWLAMTGVGLLGYYAASLFDFMALQYITAALERLVLFLYPTFVVLYSAAFAGRAIGRRDVFALAASYGGIVLVVLNDLGLQSSNVVLGTLLVLLSALCYAGHIIASGRMVQRIGTVRFASLVSLAACIGVLVHFVLVHDVGLLFDQPPPVHGWALLMAAASTVLPIVLMAGGIRRLGASQAAMVGTLGPVATIFLAYAFLDEPVTAVQLAGAALVVAGVLAIATPGNSASRKLPPVGG